MTTTRCLHSVVALVTALALSAPGVASARAKKPRTPAVTVTASVAYDGGGGGGQFSPGQCDAIATYVTEQIAIATAADLNTAAGRAAFAAAKAQIDQWLDQGMDGGCFFVGIEMP